MRGINVGGKRIPMAELRAIFEAAGAADVRTYIQSGNVVFRGAGRTVSGLRARVADALEASVGFRAALVTRTPAELAAALEADPYSALGLSHKAVHVGFLDAAPDAARVAAAEPPPSGRDTYELRGREVYVCCPDGYGKTKLTHGWFERALGVEATFRNRRTTEKLIALAAELEA